MSRKSGADKKPQHRYGIPLSKKLEDKIQGLLSILNGSLCADSPRDFVVYYIGCDGYEDVLEWHDVDIQALIDGLMEEVIDLQQRVIARFVRNASVLADDQNTDNIVLLANRECHERLTRFDR